MTVELLAIGSELLDGRRQDTNADWLCRELSRGGVPVLGRTIVADDVPRIVLALQALTRRAGAVLITGGLGPTEDDRTREALASFLARPLETDPAAVARLHRLLGGAAELRPSQARMARRPRGATWIENPVGSAPGLCCVHDACTIYALPGVPAEMRPMFRRGVLPHLASSALGLRQRRLHIAGRTESGVDDELCDLYPRFTADGGAVTILTGGEGIELVLSVRGAAAVPRLDALEHEIRRRLAADIFGADDETLAQVVGRALQRHAASVATAESCTAGLLASRITDVPGSSAWFRGGLVVYHDDLKRSLAGVSAAALAAAGAVSETVALELARGARERCAADYGLAVTGIAGPGGETPGKPVGLVWLALHGPASRHAWSIRAYGDRELVRRRAVTAALDGLRRQLLGR